MMRSRCQEKTGEGHDTLPVKERSPLNGLGASVGNLAAQGFDNLGAQQGDGSDQYQYGGTMPIAASADAVQPAVREVRL